jgi:hypothetical protein
VAPYLMHRDGEGSPPIKLLWVCASAPTRCSPRASVGTRDLHRGLDGMPESASCAQPLGLGASRWVLSPLIAVRVGFADVEIPFVDLALCAHPCCPPRPASSAAWACLGGCPLAWACQHCPVKRAAYGGDVCMIKDNG